METPDRRFNLVQQVALCSAIFLLAFGVHKALAWRETSVLPAPLARNIPLSGEDKTLARNAGRYFELNRSSTGLVTSAPGFPATTMWRCSQSVGRDGGSARIGADFSARV